MACKNTYAGGTRCESRDKTVWIGETLGRNPSLNGHHQSAQFKPSTKQTCPVLPIPEDQKPEALRRAKYFREERIPEFLGWFELILARNPEGAGQLVDSAVTYADLSLFQIVEGLLYAFPRRMQRTLNEVPRVAALHRAIAQRPRIRAWRHRTGPPKEHLSCQCSSKGASESQSVT